MRKLSAVFAIFAVSMFYGCASIFNGIGPEPISIQSKPAGAKCDIRTDKAEAVIASIITPNIVMLKKSNGFFHPAHYRVRCALENKESQEVKVNGRITGWWFGNIAIGGALGMLIIDPVTGGMWTLSPDTITINYDNPPKPETKEVASPSAKDASKTAVQPLATGQQPILTQPVTVQKGTVQ